MGRRVGVIVALVAMIATLQSPVSAAAISAPNVTAPNDGATLAYPTDPPLFRWKRVSGAASYVIEIDNAADFVGAFSASTTNTSYALTEPQTIGQPFYFHVQTISTTGAASQWSPTRSYSVAWPGSAPDLVSPLDGASVQDVVLRWKPVAGASQYQLQVSPNGDWANNLSFEASPKGTTYSPAETLNNASYFWRVRALDPGSPANAGAWSQEWQFTRSWPNQPALIAPADTLVSSVDPPTMSWDPVAHASHYQVQLGSDVNFSPGTYGECYTNHTEITYYETISSSGPGAPGGCDGAFSPQPGAVNYWRVRGIDGPGTVYSAFSDVRSFIFRKASSDSPNLQSPANGATVSTPTLKWQELPDIERYRVTIKVSGGSTVATYDTNATSVTPTSGLSVGTYEWNVQTIDRYGRLGLTDVSKKRTFTLEAPGTTTSSPDPLTPADGSSSVRMPSMTWEDVTDAHHYEIWYSVHNANVWSTLVTGLPYAGYTYPEGPLVPGTYDWYVIARDNQNAQVGSDGSVSTFTISAIGSATYVGPCVSPLTPCTVKDTPTLEWNAASHAGSYLVYLAQDAGFSNIIKTYRTTYTTLTPRESLLDNQAGNSYYWFVRPCVTPTRCARFDATVFDQAFAFRKVSKAIELDLPADGASVEDLVRFRWTDFLTTNLADAATPTQEALRYRVEVSTAADFSTLLDQVVVDQTTYTPWALTYPEGALYWRVQAIDGSGNLLTRSAVRSVTKSSPQISLQFPDAGVSFVGGVPYFRWTPQDYAARYELEIYKNGDLNFSPANKVLGQQTKMSAWAPTSQLAVGVYAWRIRRLDADGRPGPWSKGRRFTIAKSPTDTTLTVVRLSGRLKAKGKVTPPRPGQTMSVGLFRKKNGSFVKLAAAAPAIASDGSYATLFDRPAAGTCRIVARYPGDTEYRASQATQTFNC